MIWYKRDKTGFVIVGWHVDDGRVAYSSEEALAPIEIVLREHFTLKRTNEPGAYCGLKIVRNRKDRVMEIRQDTAVAEYIELTGMKGADPNVGLSISARSKEDPSSFISTTESFYELGWQADLATQNPI